MEFPRLVYKGPATHVLVHNEAEHAKAIASGWFNSVPETSGQKQPVPVAKAAVPAKENLETVALPAPVEPVAPAAKALTKAQQKAQDKIQAAAAASQAAAPVDPSAPVKKQPWD